MSNVMGVQYCRKCKTVYHLFRKSVPVVELCPKHITKGMKIKCSVCGKPVSTLVPKGTVLRAWITCLECGVKKARYEAAIDVLRAARGPRP